MKRADKERAAEFAGAAAGKIIGGKIAGPVGALIGGHVGKEAGRRVVRYSDSQKRREAAIKAWRTRRNRYGPRGHR